jgi:hypothetical protein
MAGVSVKHIRPNGQEAAHSPPVESEAFMNQSELRARHRDADDHLAHSRDCIQRSLKMIYQSDKRNEESADMLVMFKYALEDEEALRVRFHSLSIPFPASR